MRIYCSLRPITDVVLNSFALTFVVELDDIANLFESDEDALLENDWKHIGLEKFNKGDYDTRKKRRILKQIPYKTTFKALLRLCLSPLYIINFMFMVCRDGYKLIKMIGIAKQRDDKIGSIGIFTPG